MTDQYVEELKNAKKRPAVLKLLLVSLRSQTPHSLIFAFEGDDDKFVYSQWIRKILPGLVYEPFPCGSKGQVFELREIVERDRGNLAGGIFYFIDRDFDDWAGFAPDDSMFMTDNYSIENYMVADVVLEDLLKNEFHCHAHPDVRQPILDLFTRVYWQFLEATKEVNRRIYVARKLGLAIKIPGKLHAIVAVELDGVQLVRPAQDIIVFDYEPSKADIEMLTKEFDKLDPATRYRGKFAYQFFCKWLLLLADEHGKAASIWFARLASVGRVRRQEFTLSGLAAKSTPPEALGGFLRGNVRAA